MTQLLVNALASACLSLLVGISFWFIYSTTRTFYITHGASITLGAYCCYWTTRQFEVPFLAAVFVSVAVVAIVLLIVDRFVFRGLRRSSLGWAGLVASIGLYVIFQNIISLGFGDETLLLRVTPFVGGGNVWGVVISNSQLLIVIACAILYLCSVLLLGMTKLGLCIRAVASNRDLSVLFGVDGNAVIGRAVVIGSGLGAVSGILYGLDSELAPIMGFRLLMNGVVVMIIGMAGGVLVAPLAAVFLALVQYTAAFYVDAKWMDAVSFVVLIFFLVWKPLGFSGRRVKKIEI